MSNDQVVRCFRCDQTNERDGGGFSCVTVRHGEWYCWTCDRPALLDDQPDLQKALRLLRDARHHVWANSGQSTEPDLLSRIDRFLAEVTPDRSTSHE